MRANRLVVAAAAGLTGMLLAVGCSSNGDSNPNVDAAVDGRTDDAVAPDGGADAEPTEAGPQPDADPLEGLAAECPGSEGCATNDGELFAGAAAVDISPTAYEVTRVAYLREESYCVAPTPAAPFGLARCGKLAKNAQGKRADCGLDGVCPGDKLKTRLGCDDGKPCSAGLTCNVAEQACYLDYGAPDADGSEGDGVADWFLDCGRDRVCPCLDPEGAPAYFGAGDKCLTGHAANPGYQAPDADGSEGNGELDAIWFGGFTADLAMIGKHDSIWARALVLRTGETTVAIVSLDLVGVFYDDVKRIRARIAAQVKDHDIDYVLVSATHNHEGPDTMGYWGPEMASGVNKAYLAEVLDKAAKAVVDAAAGMKKVKLVASQIRTGAAGFLRDSRDPRIFNDQLIALKLDDATTGETVATVVNWGNHPEVLSNHNNYLTSDFCHYVREGMEQAIPAVGDLPALPALGGVAIYLQGTVGGLMTPLRVDVPARDGTLKTHSDWDKAEALGINVAVKAREALAVGEEIAAPRLSVWAKRLLLAVDNNTLVLAFLAKIFDREAINEGGQLKLMTEVTLIRLGPITFFSFPGEVTPEIIYGGFDGSLSCGQSILSEGNESPPELANAPKGPYLIERLPGKYQAPVGLGNDELGYIVPAWNFKLGDPPYLERAEGDHYEETNSIGPNAEPRILAVYDELLLHAGK